MREIIGDLHSWRDRGSRVALARVIDLEGSAPRLPGATMAVTEDGEVAGSVSGGCVEGAVVTESLEVLANGEGRMVTFGYSDDEAFAVGLTCGGTIHLFLEAVNDTTWVLLDMLEELWDHDLPCSLVTVVDGPGTGSKLLVQPVDNGTDRIDGTLGDTNLDRIVVRDARGELAAGRSGVRHYGEHGEAREETVQVFVESFAPPPQMLIFGAVDFTAALVRVAKVLGYRVTVCDAREVFATTKRFPLADEVVVDWPNRLLEEIGAGLGPRDAICVLTHDNKFDVPAIISALETEVGYIGVMGSRRTHKNRLGRLREAGIDDAGVERLRSPIGLDIGARTPEETAISIVSEIIALRTCRSTQALSETDGSIHD
ncbi:MAG TPA: XshC-Cox1 family protein [Acidimicrobiaceae bacterium]|nr:XshC-Cox1 family protein [Acidimicrobiaceae bacterium]HCV36730.1 XshC-Cox1 family protein [Acidimicrobiaceae bacterium]HJO79035.1 XdhC family protein [Acidimicrobiales bacterium]|tara:strand:- start:3897 stop:5009 length:1113 start_codon:yes stop_codon:yes gene_type:complete